LKNKKNFKVFGRKKRNEHKQDSKKCKNKIVDILFRAHGAFLEYHSSATFKVDRLESQLIKNLLGDK
jgi:hypothetical protein